MWLSDFEILVLLRLYRQDVSQCVASYNCIVRVFVFGFWLIASVFLRSTLIEVNESSKEMKYVNGLTINQTLQARNLFLLFKVMMFCYNPEQYHQTSQVTELLTKLQELAWTTWKKLNKYKLNSNENTTVGYLT